MQRLIWTVLVAFAAALALGPVCIAWIKRMKLSQTEYDLGPDSHKVKTGTPTMGGVIFAPALLVTPFLFFRYGAFNAPVIMAILSCLGFGLIGFLDDYIKVSRHRSLGLTPMQKIVPQFVISVGLSLWAYFTPEIGSGMTIPFTRQTVDVGIFYIPIMIFVLVGTVNSANLLDGVDGLLSSCSAVDFAFFAVVLLTLAASGDDTYLNLALLAGAGAGGLIGYLRYNHHPAQVFMGDTGSFLIGGLVAGLAMSARLSLLLPIVALAMFVSSLSDIIQIGYFKYTKRKYGQGRRVFRMAPLHHHFELGGMSENRIVAMYAAVTLALCLLALIPYIA